MVPSSALERDDAALYPAGFVAVLLHVAILILYLPALREAVPEMIGPAHVLSVRVTSFPSVEAFRHLARERVYSNREDGAAAPTFGQVVVPPSLIRLPAADARPAGDIRRNEPVPPLPDRIDHGGAVLSTRQAFLEAPEMPRPTFASPTALPTPDLPLAGRTVGLQAPAGPTGRFTAGDRPGLAGRPTRSTLGEPAVEIGSVGPAPVPSPMAGPPLTRPTAIEGSGLPPTPVPPQRPGGLQAEAPARSQGPTPSLDHTQAMVEGGRPPPTSTRARRVLRQVEPPYPEWAREQRLEPDVQFYVLVEADGTVRRTLFKRRSGYPELDRLAAEAVRQWLYEAVSFGAEWREAVIEYRIRR